MRFAALIATVLVLAFGACGEKSEPEPAAPQSSAGSGAGTGGSGGGDGSGGSGGAQRPSPDRAIELSVVAVLGGANEDAACSGFATARYVKTAYGDEQGCRAAVSKRPHGEVSVSAIDVSGQTATAKAEPASGPNKDETVQVELVNEGQTWKVDSAKSNAPPGP